MTHRTHLKWLHWLSFFIILWFWAVEPESVQSLGGAALGIHAGMGVVLAGVSAMWMGMYLRRGLASRPGPKLPGWARRMHPWMHKSLIWGLPAMVLSGGLAGFAAPYAIKLFGVIPVFPGIGHERLHGALEDLHELCFNALLIALFAHVGFHLWRHYVVKDNALRIMAPKRVHKFL